MYVDKNHSLYAESLLCSDAQMRHLSTYNKFGPFQKDERQVDKLDASSGVEEILSSVIESVSNLISDTELVRQYKTHSYVRSVHCELSFSYQYVFEGSVCRVAGGYT